MMQQSESTDQLIKELEHYRDEKLYCTITRKVNTSEIPKTSGYIIKTSADFVLLQNVNDFNLDGYSIFQTGTVSRIRSNNNDRYYDEIMRLEGLKGLIQKVDNVDLTSWKSVFQSLKQLSVNVIIENEDPADTSFDIGPILKVGTSSVQIRYFNARGVLDAEPTTIKWEKITLVKFNNRYINVFSKYLRE